MPSHVRIYQNIELPDKLFNVMNKFCMNNTIVEMSGLRLQNESIQVDDMQQ